MIRAGALLAIALLGACRERHDATHADDHHGSVDHAALMAPAPAESPRMYTAPSSFVELVRAARHGVVAIRSSVPVKSGPAAMFPGAPETTLDRALGTGFLVEAGGVFVVTTNTIASAAAADQGLVVVLDDTTEVPAKILGRDPDLDLALLAVDRPRLVPLRVGSSAELKLGEWIAVLGNPFGEEVTVAAGLVSSTGREAAGSLMQDQGMSYRTYRMFMQTDARIHRGNAGGPVLDTAGQVIGMAVATSERVGELSFVVPIDRILEILPALRDHGKAARSWLGVKVKPVTSDLGTQLGLAAGTGAYVTELVAGSPSVRSALRVGDVIVKWNNSVVNQRTLPWQVANAPAGKPSAVTVWRNRAEMVLPVVVERMPQ